MTNADRDKIMVALHDSETKYKALYETSRDAIMILTSKFGFLKGNPAAVKLFGFKTESEFTTCKPEDLSPEFQPDGLRSVVKVPMVEKIAKDNGSNTFEWLHKRPDGSEFLARVTLVALSLNDEEYLQATVQDITEQSKETQYYKNFYDNAPIGFSTTTLSEGFFIKANDELIKALEYESLEDLRTIAAVNLHLNNGREKLVETLLKNGALVNYEIPLKTKNGNIKWFSVSGKLCKGTCKVEGKCLPNCTGQRCIDLSLIDITEKNELQEKIVEMKKKQIEILKDTQISIEERLKCYGNVMC